MLGIDLLNVCNEKQCQNVYIVTCFSAIGEKYKNMAAILDFGGHVEFELGVWFDKLICKRKEESNLKAPRAQFGHKNGKKNKVSQTM